MTFPYVLVLKNHIYSTFENDANWSSLCLNTMVDLDTKKKKSLLLFFFKIVYG